MLVSGFGIVVSRCPFLQMDSPRSLAFASSSLSHSSVTLVCVVFLTRSLGASGSFAPNSLKMSCWRSQNPFVVARSAERLREHEMLTMDPGPTPDGSNSEGNSMRWTDCRVVHVSCAPVELEGEKLRTSEIKTAMPGNNGPSAVASSERHTAGRTSINLANGELLHLGVLALLERLEREEGELPRNTLAGVTLGLTFSLVDAILVTAAFLDMVCCDWRD